MDIIEEKEDQTVGICRCDLENIFFLAEIQIKAYQPSSREAYNER